MFLKIYYVPSKVMYVRSNAFLDVKGCLKFFGAVFRGVFAWSFSMLSGLGFLKVSDADGGVLNFFRVDGVECYG